MQSADAESTTHTLLHGLSMLRGLSMSAMADHEAGGRA
jgi:hypothetical protein